MDKKPLILVLVILAIVGCKEGRMKQLAAWESRIDAVPQASWDRLAKMKIFFGHQSVGQNVLEGIREVMASHPVVRLDIKDTTDPADFGRPVFAHALVGENKDPQSKIDRFRAVMDGGVGRLADIVLLKLCFVDIDRTTDIEGLFKSYEDAVRDLAANYPNLKIISVTVPLTTQPLGLKPLVKKVLGRYPWIKDDNARRHLFNERLRKTYGSMVYDLADRETTSLGGEKASFAKGPERFYLLQRAFTSDGGHLNALGRRVVATDLLCFLAEIAGR